MLSGFVCLVASLLIFVVTHGNMEETKVCWKINWSMCFRSPVLEWLLIP